MNRTYRSIWNEVRRTFVAAAEKVQAKGKPASRATSLTASAATLGAGALLRDEGQQAQAPPAASRMGRSLIRPLALEQRFMFDGAAVATAVDAVIDLPAPDVAEIAVPPALTAELLRALQGNTERTTEQAAERQSLDTAPETRRELIVVDWTVEDYKTLIAGIDPSTPIVVLQPGESGLAGLADALKDYQDLDAIHLVTHGWGGALQLGRQIVTSDTLTTQADDVQAIADALKAGGDLMLYGCSVAYGERGLEFVEDLTRQLGDVDVAASTDKTGPTALQGDWDLEWSSGEIETVLPFTLQGMQDIGHCLGCTISGTNIIGPDGSTVFWEQASVFGEGFYYSQVPLTVYNLGQWNSESAGELFSGTASEIISWTQECSVAANTAPTLSDTTLSFAAIDEDSGNPTGAVGSLISSIVTLGGNVTDTDSGAVTGIAITATDSTNGTWYFSTNNGSTWSTVGTVSASSALLLRSTDRIYFKPNADYAGTVSNGITFRAWDQTGATANQQGTKVDASANGGTTAFSSATDTVSITVNDLPDPEIAVSGNSTDIADGDSTPSSTDHTDFGSTAIAGGTVSRIFTINNTGTAALTLGTVTVGGAHAADFTVTSQPSLGVAAGESTIFTVQFDPSAAGTRSATLSFSTNDSNENPFNFSIQGTGVANTAPTLTAISNVTGGTEDTEKQISFAGLQGVANEADSDGNVTAFVVKAVSTGSLKIGLDADSATAWDASTNATIDATHLAFWTPASNANGNLNAFTVVAKDDGGAESSTPVQVVVETAAVNDAPTDIAVSASTLNQSAATSAATIGTLSGTDPENDTLTYTLVSGVDDTDNGKFTIDGTTLKVGGDALTAGSYSIRVRATDNGTGNLTYEEAFTITVNDDVAPTLSSSTPSDNANGIAPSANIALTFSETIAAGTGNITLYNVSTGATVETFDVATGVGSAGGTASISGSTLTLNPSANLAEATQYAIQIANTAIKDAANNTFAGIANNTTLNFTTGVSDSAAPVLQSIQRTAAENTNAATLTYTLKFNEAVTAADVADLELSTTGNVSGTITGVTGSGTDTLTVTVGSVAGTGKLGLNLKSGQNITDIAGNALATSEPADDEVYNVDRTLPTLLSINRSTSDAGVTGATSLEFIAVFSEPVSGLATDDFALTGTASGTIASVSGNGTPVITITVNGISGNGSLGLALAASPSITDAAGNNLTNTSPSTTIAESYTIDTTAPTAVSILRTGAELTTAGSVTFDVVFSETVANVTADDFQLTGTASGTIASITGSGSAYTVTVNSVTGDGTLGLSYVGGQNIADAAGNAFAGTLPSRNETYTVDNSTPEVSAINRAGVNQIAASTATDAVFTVVFSEPVSGLTSGDFTVTGTAANGGITSVSSSDGKAFRVTVGAVNGTVGQTVGINFTGSVTDRLSQTGSASFTTGQTYTIGGVLLNEGAVDQATLDELIGVNRDGTQKIVSATGPVAEVVIIDSRVPGLAEHLGELRPGVEVWMLDAGSSALNQISGILAQYDGLTAIHLISHGSSAAVYLGAETISSATLSDQSAMLANWGNALSESGDFLIYGCDVAKGDAGTAFVTAFAAATGADVAASDDLTGASWLGGDWELEYSVGRLGISAINVDQYGYSLAIVQGYIASATTKTLAGYTWNWSMGDGSGNSTSTPARLNTGLFGSGASGVNDAELLFGDGNNNNGTGAGEQIVVYATDGKDFTIKSFQVITGIGSATISIVGYKDGNQVYSDSKNFAEDGLIFGAETYSFSGGGVAVDKLVLTHVDNFQYDDATSLFNFLVDYDDAPANIAPTINNFSGDILTYIVGTGAVVIDQGTAAGVTDDSANFDTGTLTVTGAGTGDLIRVQHQGTGVGQIGVSGSSITYAGATIGTYSGGLASNLTVTFNANATPEAVSALLQNLTYRNDTETSTASRSLSITVSDGDGATSTAATVTVSLSPATSSQETLLTKIGQQYAFQSGTIGGYNASTDQGAIAVFDPNPLGADGLGTTWRNQDAFFMYEGKLYGMFVDPGNAYGFRFGRFDGTQVEYFGTQTFEAMNSHALGDGKIYFTGALASSGFKVFEFDVANTTLTEVAATQGDAGIQYYAGQVYFFTPNYAVERWDGTTVETVWAANTSSAIFSNNMVVMNGELYFGAEQPNIESYGAINVNFREIFKYNAATNTITQLTDRNATTNFYNTEIPKDLREHDGKIFFSGSNSSYNPPSTSDTAELNDRDLISVASDGTTTVEFDTGNDGSVLGTWKVNGSLYFAARMGGEDFANLYKYNSTGNATNLSGFTSGTHAIADVLSYNGDLYFTSSPTSGVGGTLYKYSGTTLSAVSTFPSLVSSGDNAQGFEPGLVVFTGQLAPVVSGVLDLVGILAGGSTAVAPSLTVTDIDSPSITGATVTITGGLAAGDSLSFTSANGITGSYDSNTGVLTLTGTTSAANYQSVLRSVTFTADSTAGQREFLFALTDSDGNPSWANSPSAKAYIAVGALGGDVAMIDFASDPTGGSQVGSIDIANPNLGNVTISVDNPDVDTGLTWDSGLEALNIVSDSTDPTKLTISSSNGREFDLQGLRFNDNYNWSTFDLVFTGFKDDVQTVQVTMPTFSINRTGTIVLPTSFDDVDKVEISLGAITQSQWVTSPAGLIDDVMVLTASSGPVNAPPTISNLDTDSVAWAGVGNVVTLDAATALTIADTENDADNWNGASLTVNRVTGGSADATANDVFAFDTAGASFSLSGSDLQSGGNTFATFTSTGGVLTVTFTGSGTNATNALVEEVMQRVTYRNDTPAGDATIRFTLADGDGASTTADVSVTSDTIYVTNTSDTGTIAAADGVGLREAVAIALADTTGTQTIVFGSALAGQTITLGSTLSITENLAFDADAASGLIITGSTINLGAEKTLTINNGSSDTVTISSTISGDGELSKTGNGKLTLSGTNSGDWTTRATGGTLEISAAANLGSGDVTLSGGVIFATVGNTLTLANTFAIETGGATFNQTVGGHLTVSGAVSGDGRLTKAGGGSMTLSADNESFPGGVTINNGTLNATSTGESLGYGSVTLNGGTLAISGATTFANDIELTGDATLSNGSALTLSGVLSGSGALSKSGSGVLTLSGNSSSYSGDINLNQGVIIVTHSNALGNGTGSTTVASGTTLRVGNGLSIAENLTLSGVGINSMYGALKINEGTGSTTISGNITLAANTYIGAYNAGDRLTLTGNISGNFNLTKVGSGTVNVNGTDSRSGTTTVSTGTLGGTGSIAGAVNVSNGATLAPGVAGVGKLTLGGDLTLASGAILAMQINGNTAGTGYDQLDVTGAVSLGGATLSVSTTNSYSIPGGSIITLINNDASDAVTGTFTGLAEGASVTVNGVATTVSYGGGSGNDVVLAVAPMLQSASPADNATGIAPTSNVVLTFDADVQLGSSGTITLYDITGAGANSITIDVTNHNSQLSTSANTLTINPTANLITTNQYAVRFTAGAIVGTGGNVAAIADSSTLNFTTGTTDAVAPTVTIVDVADPASTNAGTVAINFSEQVQNVDISDFTLTRDGNSVDISGLTVAGSGSQYTLDLSSVTAAAGTYVLTLNTSNITDTSGNALAAGASETFVIDKTAPTGVAILRASANPMGAGTASFTVAFSESVTGVTADDFTLTGTATSGASIGTVTRVSDSVYTVTVTGVSGNGTLGLDLNSSDTNIVDLAGNALSGGRTGQLFTVDNTAPSVVAINRNGAEVINGTSASFTVSFAEAVTGVDASDFTLDETGGMAGDIAVSGSGSTYTVTLSNVTGATGTLSIDLKSSGTGIVDLAGNAIAAGFTQGDTYTRDTTNPSITASQSFSIPENMADGYVIGQVRAADANGVAGFAITSGDTSGFFAIDANGVITLTTAGAASGAASRDYETTPNSFNLGVTVTDTAGNTAVETVTISILDEQEDQIAPVVTLNSGSLVYTENGAATPVSPTATVVEADNPGGSVLTVSISANAESADVLSLPTGTNTGINVNGTDLRNGTTNIGTVTAANVTGSTAWVITFLSSATQSDIQETVRTISYRNTSDDPSGLTRTVQFSLKDGMNNVSTAATRDVAFTVVNDAPTATAGGTLAYTEQGTAAAIDNAITLADLDDTQLAGATVTIGSVVAGDVLGFTTQNGISGSYDANTGVLTLSGTATVAQYQTALRSVMYSSTSDAPTVNDTRTSRTITWAVTDANSDNVGAKTSTGVTSTVNLTAVNDTPTATAGGSLSYTEQGAAAAIDNTITLADADDTEITGATVSITSPVTGDVLGFTTQNGISGSYDANTGVLTLSGTATVAQYQTALRSVTYNSTSDDPTVNDTRTSRTITWAVTDANSDNVGAKTSTGVTSTVNLTAVNDTPTATAGGSLSYTEQGTAAAIDNSITLADLDDTQLAGATVTIGSVVAGDVLGFTTQNGISGSYDANTGVLTLSGTATVAHYQTALRSVTYSSTSDDPTVNDTRTSRTITWAVTDANSDNVGAKTSTGVTSTVNLTAVNDAPTVAKPISDQSFSGAGNWTFAVPSDTFGDLDGDALSLSATLSDGSPLPGWMTFDAATKTFSGNPPNGVGALSVKVTADDGLGGKVSDDFALTLTAVNDAPQFVGAIGDQVVDEGNSLNFTFPANFVDADADSLSYRATQSDGSPLPVWLSFDPITRTFSGTPADRDVGQISVRVEALDGQGGSGVKDFTLRVSDVNQAPDGNVSVTGTLVVGGVLEAANTLSDLDGIGTISYQWQFLNVSNNWQDISGATSERMTLVDALAGKPVRVVATYVDARGAVESVASSPTGLVAALPAVPVEPTPTPTTTPSPGSSVPTVSPPADPPAPTVPANPPSVILSTTIVPPVSNPSAPDVPLGAAASPSDPGSQTPVGATLTAPAIPGGFQIVVAPKPEGAADSLVVNRGVSDVIIATGRGSEFAVPADAFAHTNPDVTIQLEMTLINGEPLPPWVEFDPATGKVKVQPPLGVDGELVVRVVAKDSQGREAIATFKVRVGNDRQPIEGRSSFTEQLRMASRPLGVTDRLAALSRSIQAAQRLRV